MYKRRTAPQQKNAPWKSIEDQPETEAEGDEVKQFAKTVAGPIFVLIAAVLGCTPAAVSQGTGAKLHGHVTNAAGAPLKTGDVKLTTDKSSAAKDRVYKFSFPIDANGDYKGADINPGDYVAVVFVDGKTVDFQDVVLKANDDRPLDFDMTRAEYLKQLTPEERKAIEENKAHNAQALAENAKIADINKTLLQARADEKNGKAADAVTALQGLTAARPNEEILWGALGEAQLALADDAYKAARAAKTPTTDPAIVQKYTDSAASYQKAIDLAPTAKKPNPEALSVYYQNKGKALGRAGKLDESAAAYDASAKAFPASAGQSYYNESAELFNQGKTAEAGAAASKAIQADPKRPEPYYIRAQANVGKATMDPKTNKFVLPPGCLEDYQTYLELAPDGKFAAEVQELLKNLGQPVKNTFKAGKK